MGDYVAAARWQDVNTAEWPWANFSPSEMACRHTGKIRLYRPFMDRLQIVRISFGAPMRVTSGYRDPLHPIEARKATPGSHALGRAVDIGIEGAAALKLLMVAHGAGFTGFGVNQKGAGRFIHLDDLPGAPGRPRPHVWSY